MNSKMISNGKFEILGEKGKLKGYIFLYIVDLKKKSMDILDFKCNGKNLRNH